MCVVPHVSHALKSKHEPCNKPWHTERHVERSLLSAGSTPAAQHMRPLHRTASASRRRNVIQTDNQSDLAKSCPERHTVGSSCDSAFRSHLLECRLLGDGERGRWAKVKTGGRVVGIVRWEGHGKPDLRVESQRALNGFTAPEQGHAFVGDWRASAGTGRPVPKRTAVAAKNVISTQEKYKNYLSN
jgi:hypothetical protein